LEGITMMNRVLTQLREAGVNPNLEIFGVVMTMFDGRTKLSNEVVTEVRKMLGSRVFETVIPRKYEGGGSAQFLANRSFITINTARVRRLMKYSRGVFEADKRANVRMLA